MKVFGYQGDGNLNFGDESAGGEVLADISDGASSGLALFSSPALASFVQGLVNAGATWAGFNIRDMSDVLDGRYAYITNPVFGNQERLTVGFEPRAVPEPVTLTLFGIGLGGLWLVRRRTKA